MSGTSQIQCGSLSVVAEQQSIGEAQFIFREIFEKQIYLQHGIELPPGSTILDVGANIGLFSLFALQQCPDCRLYCFEPVPNNYRMLETNLNTYGNGAIYLSPLALSNSSGTRDITYFPLMPGNSTLSPNQKLGEIARFFEHYDLRDAWNWSGWAFAGLLATYPFRKPLQRHFGMKRYAKQQTFTCGTKTLDEIFDAQNLQHVQLLKIDTEGEELAILDGLSDENLSKVQQIVFESPAGNRPRLAALRTRLQRNGFSGFFIDNPRDGGGAECSVWPDLIFALR